MVAKKQAKKTTKGKAGDTDVTTIGLAAGVLLVIFAVLYMLWPGGDAQTAEYESYLSSIGVRHGKVDIKCNGTSQDRWCALVAKRSLQQGDKVLHVPMNTVIQPQDVMRDTELGAALQVQDAGAGSLTKLGELLQTKQLGGVYGAFLVAFKIWHEMRKTDLRISSPLSAWLEVVSKSSELRHVAYWTEEEAACLDPFSAMERNNGTIVQFTELAAFICEENPALSSCAGFDSERAFKEMQWAYATLRQRAWGELAPNPMIIPLVDFAFPHPTLCAPESEGGDGDALCAGRESRTALHPQQEGESINWISSVAIPKGGYIFSAHRPLAVWDSLGIYGYVDYAAGGVPDQEFASRLGRWIRKTQTNMQQLVEDHPDHPLRGCDQQHLVAWTTNGQPRKELRYCWAAYFYITLTPEAAVWDESAAKEHRKWKKNKKEQAKSAYLVQRALLRAAGGVFQHFQQNDVPAHCKAEDRTVNAYRAFKVREIILGTLGKAMQAADKAQVEKFDSWAKLDPSADRDVSDTPPEPAPVADDEPAEDEGGDLEDADPTEDN